jgi:hypothetical protein
MNTLKLNLVGFSFHNNKYEDSKKGYIIKSNKDPISKEVNIAPDFDMFHTKCFTIL